MRLDITLPDLTPSCCDNLVYAILYNKNQSALKDNGFGVLTLQPYVEANHDDYAIILAEHGERDRYYYVDIADANLILPDNPRGEVYQIEFWRKPVAGTFTRSDELRETRRVTVSAKTLVDAMLSAAGVKELGVTQAHLSAVYDSENSILRFMSHLDINGELVTNPTSCRIFVSDSAGASVIDVTSTTYITNQPGIFYQELPNQTLANDHIFIAKSIITDSQGAQHTTVSYLESWD